MREVWKRNRQKGSIGHGSGFFRRRKGYEGKGKSERLFRTIGSGVRW